MNISVVQREVVWGIDVQEKILKQLVFQFSSSTDLSDGVQPFTDAIGNVIASKQVSISAMNGWFSSQCTPRRMYAHA